MLGLGDSTQQRRTATGAESEGSAVTWGDLGGLCGGDEGAPVLWV